MAHASSSATRRSWLHRLRSWWQPAAPAPAAPAFAPRRSPLNINGSDPYVGEIAIFCGNYAPNGWAFCDGRLLSIGDNSLLFQLIGTTYGGNGETTFAVPDLRGRAPMHSNPIPGPSLSNRQIGETGGTETVTLSTQQLPSHSHQLGVSTAPGTTASPLGAVPADGGNGSAQYTPSTANLLTQPSQVLGGVGGNTPHENMQPFLVVNYIISLSGTFPSQA
jgi:microcystin-dependent protein